MISFRSPPDILNARLPPHLHQLVSLQMESLLATYTHYTPEHDGYLTLITPTDTDQRLCSKLGLFWSENIFEGVLYNKKFKVFIAMILTNNQFCITVLIPDEPWLEPKIRERVQQQVEGGECYC